MCDYCADMDGQHFPEKDRKIGENAPPFHPWCRCTTAPYFEDMRGVGERWMRNPETGKGDYVPSDMTYKEWKEIYVDKTSTMEEWTAKHVDKSAESGIINTYPGKSESRHTNEIPQEVKAKVAEAESAVVHDIPLLSGWHEPIAYGSVEGGLALHDFDYKTGRCTITLLDSAFSDPERLMEQLQRDYDTCRSYEVKSYQSLVAHEIGHNAHICLAMKRCGFEYGTPLTYSEALRVQNQMDSVINEIYDKCFFRWKENPETIINKSIVDFGTISIQTKNELLAQAFGKHYFGKKRSKIADTIVEFFKEELGKYVQN